MNLLFFGDVVGQMSCDYIEKKLPELKRKYGADLVICNGENSAEGNGILPNSAHQLWDAGVDVITTGNHSLRRRECHELYDEDVPLIRPANYHKDVPGRGYYIVDMLRYQFCIVNIQGRAYMDPVNNPFDCMDQLLEKIDTPNILVDFHAEATAEKQAMAWYLDGRVSAVVGTHTHVQTADERILPGGTAYITDVGMCGGYHSVLGAQPQAAIKRLRTGMITRFANATEHPAIWGVFIEIDEKNGKARSIERIFVTDEPTE